MLRDIKAISCPRCQQPSSLDEGNLARPFCSDRCKLIDLGSWASEDYAIPTEEPLPEVPDSQDE